MERNIICRVLAILYICVSAILIFILWPSITTAKDATSVATFFGLIAWFAITSIIIIYCEVRLWRQKISPIPQQPD